MSFPKEWLTRDGTYIIIDKEYGDGSHEGHIVGTSTSIFWDKHHNSTDNPNLDLIQSRRGDELWPPK